jgi:hypothetical protein
MIVLNGIRVRTCNTIANAPATPPPTAIFSVFFQSTWLSNEIPCPVTARAAASGKGTRRGVKRWRLVRVTASWVGMGRAARGRRGGVRERRARVKDCWRGKKRTSGFSSRKDEEKKRRQIGTDEDGIRVPERRGKLVRKVNHGDGGRGDGYESPEDDSKDVAERLDLLLGDSVGSEIRKQSASLSILREKCPIAKRKRRLNPSVFFIPPPLERISTTA